MSAEVDSLIIHVKQVGIVELIFELPADLTILGGIRAEKMLQAVLFIGRNHSDRVSLRGKVYWRHS